MSSRPTPSPQPEFTTPAPTGLVCPICGGPVIRSWWVADLLLCERGCYWSGPERACKPAATINDGGNVLHAGDSQ